MSMKSLVVLSLGVLPFVACGGGEATKTESAPTTEAPKAAAAPATSAGSASVSGKISFEGTPPAAEKVKLTADAKCAEMHKDGLMRQQIKVKDGGLAEVLVYVKSGLSGTYPPPEEPVLLDQNGCDYAPHMVAMMAGQKLKIRNSDDTLHNIHPRPQANTEFNQGQAKKGMEMQKLFDKPELLIPVGCDVHPWMRAYISVLSNPFFAVTGEDGSFEIKGLPAGEYEIEAAHGKLKTVSSKVTVKDGEAAKLSLTFKG
jgi:plastocyanin